MSKHVISILLAAVLITGCSLSPPIDSTSYTRGDSINTTARSQLGTRYKFGGRYPQTGFDCSGLAWFSHKVNGVEIPRSSFKQYRGGIRVSRRDLRPGDLVFFETYKRGASHVGIYTGQGKFIHSPNSGKSVEVQTLSNNYFRKRYIGARRYW